jgi:hypothetical protein
MLDWLTARSGTGADLGLAALAARLAVAAGYGVAVAAVYFLTQRKNRAEAGSFVSTLVLLTVLLAMVSLVVGSDIARAFSLVGALSIVRFRTVVEDTRDTAFVIFAVITGMAVGAGSYEVPAVGVPVVAAAAWAMRAWAADAAPRPGRLVVRLGVGQDPDGPLAEVLRRHAAECRLLGVATARQGAAVDLTYAVRLRDPAAAVALAAELNRTEGVQGVEWGEAPAGT